jgi:hypothetical protein
MFILYQTTTNTLNGNLSKAAINFGKFAEHI